MNHSSFPHSSLIGIETKGEVGVITLSRPEKRNAMNEEMITVIGKVFASPPPAWKAVLIEAEGDHFSAGLDLSEHKSRSPEQVMDISSHWHRATQAIIDSRIPVVCALKGYVIGAGLELATAAHVRFADPEAVFCLPEGRRGIFVGGGASVRVGRLIGTSRLIELMLSGREVDCREANAIGLCQRVSAPGRSSEDAFEFAREVATNAPLSNRMILLALTQIAEMPPAGGLFTESLAAALTQTSPEALERINAFFNKPRTKR
ncbi:enoyl-CoA hydratase/carnithine racemase [Hoeflea sp. IMCC20628]|uniref:crotonase/enoyl-CoA hydratase family protein n=1 Tax=Hoeflea sp. IMCC20628 TaxID=1620421 RepID=UPI00063ACF02|nr:crotonase/enoyl-CoA hydratase family protein [Hoeflea sp. IMCC20628]AKI00731.1 enoyl-CoA hydratase/carnithine racemase [Hoeflea sp. IMCC20628]